jgi:hypothetical protein
MSPYAVHVQRLNSIPLAVIRRQANAAELARIVPECCGLVWNVVRAQKVKAGRHVAIYWDGSIRLEVGVELQAPFSDQGEVVRSATPAGMDAFRILCRPGRRARCRASVLQGEPSPACRSELGDLRALGVRVGRRSFPHSDGRVSPTVSGVRLVGYFCRSARSRASPRRRGSHK